MATIQNLAERRTTVDAVFDYLYSEIASLRLLPGAKISEAEIASLFDVSRQPVRDAFSRLANLDLVLIRPQRATVVKRFSSQKIKSARFVRAAVEAKVTQCAAQACTNAGAALLDACIKDQKTAVKANDSALFTTLDYQFHKTLSVIGEVEFAFEVIQREKAKVDRLCALSLAGNDKLDLLLEDHILIAKSVKENNVKEAVEVAMLHLSRLDDTITLIQAEHADYFDD
jgi:DNA-binding GntR family transcriptional regulator